MSEHFNNINGVTKLYDPLAIIALVVSIASVAFIIMKEGIGLALGYRESAATSRRKREIDSKLRAEVRVELRKFLVSLTKKERDDEKELESIVELGQSAYFARSISGKLLEDMTQYMSSALGLLAATLASFFATLYIGANADFSMSYDFVAFVLLVGLAFFAFYMTTKQLKKHYSLRERFVRLGENPSLGYCRELLEDLKKEGSW